MNTTSKARAAKAAAILYLQSHGETVKVGDSIEYAEPSIGGGYSRSSFVVEKGDLELAANVRAGSVDLPHTDQGRMTATLTR